MTSGRKTKPPKPDKTPGATPAWNEWGIPDWRDPAAYGETRRWTFARWRWEFFRRRNDVRTYFQEALKENEEVKERWKFNLHWHTSPNIRPDEPGFAIRLNKRDQSELGFNAILNPAIGNQTEKILQSIFWAYDFVIEEFNTPDMRHPKVIDYLRLHNIKITEEDEIRLGETFLHSVPYWNLREKDEVVLSFDLRRPMMPQIEAAQLVLKECYALVGKPSQKRRRPAKWLDCLRTLDAREAGASWREIADLLYAQGVLSRYKNPSGGYSPPPPQAASALWNMAKGLQSNF